MNLSEYETKQWAVIGVSDHPWRDRLTNEIHARPSLAVKAPLRVTHLALLSGEGAAEQERKHLLTLCQRFGAAEPPANANYWLVDLGSFTLNWERHTEFSTYTFLRQGAFDHPFREPAITQVPQDWLSKLSGEVLVAIHLALEANTSPELDSDSLTGLFASDNIASSAMSDGSAIAWSDFRLQGDGYTRYYVRDVQLKPRQAGRLIQRLLEIETYRMMALLALPVARKVGADVSQAEAGLTRLTEQLASSKELKNDHVILEQLTQLAADVERLAASSSYRFGAARAYYTLVQRRITELREKRLLGRAPLQEFMDRRLAPAMRTCESVNERLTQLSDRISKAANLLRTRVDVALEAQNRDLLESMNRRAKLQLRLQETVEGLSVVVLSYYLVGLISYVLKALKASGIAINPELITGLTVPIVCAVIWFGLNKVRWLLLREHDKNL